MITVNTFSDYNNRNSMMPNKQTNKQKGQGHRNRQIFGQKHKRTYLQVDA